MTSRGALAQAQVIQEALGELGARRVRRDAMVPADVLGSVPLFAGLSRRHLRKLSRVIDEVHYRDGRVIVQKGTPGDSFFVLAEGSARVYPGVVPGGRTKARLHEGDFFGEMSLLDGKPRSATVVADGTVSAFKLTRPAFLNVLSSEPTIAIRVLADLAGRLRKGAVDE